MESKALTRRSLDDALKLVGSFGRFHISLLILNIFFQLFVPWMSQIITFIGATPEYLCKPHIGDNESDYNDPVFGSTSSPESLTCERYVDPVWRNETEECTDGWWYSNQTYGENIVTEFDLVCSKKGLTDLAQSSMMLGGAFGSIIAGFIADHIGRRPVIICSLAIFVASGLALIFSPNISVFIALFTIYGATQPGFWSNCHILFTEYLVPSKRSRISAFPPFFQSVGSVLLAVLAYYIRDWRYLQAVLIFPYIILLSVVWLVPESARWHISRGNFNKSENILKRIAVLNRKNSQGPFLHEDFLKEDIQEGPLRSPIVVTDTHTETTPPTTSEAERYDASKIHTNHGFSLDEENEVTFLSDSRVDQNVLHNQKDDIAPKNGSQEPKSELVKGDIYHNYNDIDNKEGIPTISANIDAMSSDSDGEVKETRRSILDVFKPPVLYITLSVCTIRTVYSVVYFGFVLNTGNLAGNPYLNFIIGGIIEIPARMIPVVLIKRLGGRFITSTFFLLSAVTLTVIVLIPEETDSGKNLGTVITAVSLFGRFLVTVTNASCLLMSMELFPTTVRTLGTGVAQFFGRFGGFLAPLMLYLDNVFPGFSLIAMAVGSLTASILAFLLPETLNEPQPETPEDLKKMMGQKRRLLPTKTVQR
ncbi:solute carrier family 22 member 6-like isoform X2 [Apostichopus japonicus]|uniref:solute carrier family 22 member 6-like isoform X2 n=1 Tax=Stichopus japonicus TaxID=307972 RepID=UPI003AB1DDAC